MSERHWPSCTCKCWIHIDRVQSVILSLFVGLVLGAALGVGISP